MHIRNVLFRVKSSWLMMFARVMYCVHCVHSGPSRFHKPLGMQVEGSSGRKEEGAGYRRLGVL